MLRRGRQIRKNRTSWRNINSYLIAATFLGWVFSGTSFGAPLVKWIEVPAGSYKPLFNPPEYKTKRLLPPKESEASRSADPILIQVNAFEVLRNPVTNRDFRGFLLRYPGWRRDQVKSLFVDAMYLENWPPDTSPQYKAFLRKPVVSISWFAANSYCNSIGARLPTNDEWEYISSLDDSDLRDAVILNWYSDPSAEQGVRNEPTFIGKLGVIDMYGKIWEWTMDFNSTFEIGESEGQSKGLFCGAGSVGSANPRDYASFMRMAFRSSLSARYSLANLGFRCARDRRLK